MKQFFQRSAAFTLGLIFLLSSGVEAQFINGSQNVIETEFDVINFHSIVLKDKFDLEVIQSEEFKILVMHDDNLTEYLNVSINNETLELGLWDAFEYIDVTLKVRVFLPNLRSLTGKGTGDITIPKMETDSLSIVLKGASSLEGHLTINNKLAIQALGASGVTLQGTAQSADLRFGGASYMESKDFIVHNSLDVACSAAGWAELTVNGDIRAYMRDVASFTYYGTGQVIRKQLQGGGSVIKGRP